MCVSAKVAANRANAAKSTGPRTAEGKARASRNATTHGLFAADVLVPGEDPAVYEAVRDATVRRLNPRDGVELTWVEEFIRSEWKLRRIRAAEQELFIEESRVWAAISARTMHDVSPRRAKEMAQTPVPSSGQVALTMIQPASCSALERLCRYQTRLVNTMGKCMTQLQKLRTQLVAEDELSAFTETLLNPAGTPEGSAQTMGTHHVENEPNPLKAAVNATVDKELHRIGKRMLQEDASATVEDEEYLNTEPPSVQLRKDLEAMLDEADALDERNSAQKRAG